MGLVLKDSFLHNDIHKINEIDEFFEQKWICEKVGRNSGPHHGDGEVWWPCPVNIVFFSVEKKVFLGLARRCTCFSTSVENQGQNKQDKNFVLDPVTRIPETLIWLAEKIEGKTWTGDPWNYYRHSIWTPGQPQQLQGRCPTRCEILPNNVEEKQTWLYSRWW